MAFKIKKSVLNVTQLISADIVTKVVGIAVLGFYTRYLPKEHLSLLPIYGMLGGMSTLFFSFGIFPTFVKLLPSMLEKDTANARAMIFTGSSIIMIGAALFSFGIYCFSEKLSLLILHDVSYSNVLEIMSVGFFAVGLRTVFNYVMWSASRFDKMSFLKIFQSVSNAVLTIGLFLLSGLKGFVLGMVIRDVICVCLSVVFLKDILFCNTVRFYSVKKLLKQSLPFYLEGYLMYFRSQGDNWIVSTFLGPASMAIYYIAKRLYDMLSMIFESADKVITASLSSKHQDKKNVEEYISRLVAAISQTIFPFVFFIIGLTPAFIYIVAGETYGDSIIPSIILSLTILVHFISGPIGRGIFVLKSPATRFKLTLVESLCLMTALLSLTTILSEAGVALSRFIASAVAGVYAYFILRTVISVRIPIRQMAVSFSISLLVAAFLLTCQALNFSFYILPFYICGSLLIFFFFTSKFNSSGFYETLNSILPFKVVDPVKLCLSWCFKPDESNDPGAFGSAQMRNQPCCRTTQGLASTRFAVMPIIILGTNHSGTRVLVDIMSILDSDGGDYRNQWHENKFFLEIHKELLFGRPDISLGQKIFSFEVFEANPLSSETSRNVQRKLEKGLSSAYPRYRKKPWHWKCPTSALFIDFWMKVYPEAYYVHIVRNPLDVAASLITRKQFLTIASAERFYCAMEDRMAQVNDGNHKYICLKYEILETELTRLLAFLPFLDKSHLDEARNIIKRRSISWNRKYSLKRNLWVMSVALRINTVKIIRRIKGTK